MPRLANVEVPPTFDLQGHRGARGLRPENTLVGFELALDMGVKTLEFDLHLTADDVVVVWHDPIVSGLKCSGPGLTTDGEGPRVRDLRYAELSQYRCDKNPDPTRFPAQSTQPGILAGDDFRITSLAALLDFVDTYANSPAKTAAQRRNAASVRFNMETKRVKLEPWRIDDGFDGRRVGVFERELLSILQRRNLVSRTIVQSFDFRSLGAVKAAAPEVTTSALTEGDIDLQIVVETGARYWSPHHGVITPKRLEDAHALGLAVLPWTVNDPARALELVRMGVDGLITDFAPDLLYDAWP